MGDIVAAAIFGHQPGIMAPGPGVDGEPGCHDTSGFFREWRSTIAT